MPYRQIETPELSYFNPKPYRGIATQGQIQYCPQDEIIDDGWDIFYVVSPIQGSLDFCPQDETIDGGWTIL